MDDQDNDDNYYQDRAEDGAYKLGLLAARLGKNALDDNPYTDLDDPLRWAWFDGYDSYVEET